MTLYEEIYFDITLTGKKAELERFISFLNGGGLDDFFEMDDSYIDYDDSYKSTSEEGETYITFSRPTATPTPMCARPASFMTAETSAKSRLMITRSE